MASGALTSIGHPTTLVASQPTRVTLPDEAAPRLVSRTSTDTLTNKTLTSPTITTPTISGAILTGPTISGVSAITVSSATVTLGATHVGRVVILDRATGIAATLPAATGSGDKYELFVKTTFTGAASVTRAGSDTLLGTAILFADTGDAVVGFNTTAGTSVSLFGTGNAQGGIAGATIVFTDLESTKWRVQYVSDAGGTEATPFS